MKFVLFFSFLPISHTLATTSIASLILSHASCQIILPPLPLVCSTAKSVTFGLWRGGVVLESHGCGSLPGQGDSAGHKHKCQMLRSCKLGSWASTQHCCLLTERKAFWYLPEIFLFGWRHLPVFLFFPPLILRNFFKTFQTDSLWAEVFLMNKIKGPH